MRNLFPQTIRNKMILFTLLMVSIPMLLTGYVVKLKAEEALLEEKQIKLFGIAVLLDNHLGDGYNQILKEKGALHADRQTKIKVLNEALKNYTDTVVKANPGVGAGYYNKELDAIITYGPSEHYADKVGVSIEPSHPGRVVMDISKKKVESGRLVRGNIMNCMTPIQRDGKVIGYIWTNEFTDDIRAQMAVMDYNIYLALGAGIIISMALIFWMSYSFAHDVETIKRGLENLKFDLRRQLRPMDGEMGEICEAINHMARSLVNASTLTENIMHSIADGIITVDNNGNITSINRTAERVTGFTPESIIDKSFTEVFSENESLKTLLNDTLSTGTNHADLELDYSFNKKCLHMSVTISRLKDSVNQIIGAVLVFKDLTEQHRLQAQINRAERLASLGELMAGVAHEIRNPLTSIKGFVQYLESTDDEQERKEYMPVIIKEVDRVNRVIQELLNFARPYKTDYKLVNINGLLQETLVLIQNKSIRHKIEINLQFAEGLPWIEGDAEQLKQVFLNLFINAVQAMEYSGEIEVSTWQEERNFVYVKIKDTGSGINIEDLDKIFDPFFTTKPTGTGLGLAVVQRIISAHHGQVDIKSQVGAGTAITVKLPVEHQRGREHE